MSDSEPLSVGPPRNSEQPQCSDCGSFETWVDKHEEIKELHDAVVADPDRSVLEEVPPGPWGYWTCPRCGGDE